MSNAIASNAFVIPQRHLSGGTPEPPTKGGCMRKRNNLIQIWLSDDELEKLSTQAAKCGLPMMRQLYYCGNNLNQIAKKAHALNVIDVQHYDEVVNLFRQTVQEISNAVISPK